MTNVDVIVVKAKEALMSLRRNDRVHIFKPIYFSAFRQRITNTDILKEAINSFDTVLMKQYLSRNPQIDDPYIYNQKLYLSNASI